MTDTETNISPEGVTPPNTSPKADTTQEGADTPRPYQPYQWKQWAKDVWERGSDNKLKEVQSNKLN